VDIRVRYGRIKWVHQAVLDDEVNLGLVCYPRRLHGLQIEPFRHERLVLVCHPQHPLANLPAVALPSLRGHRFVAWKEIRWTALLQEIPKNLRHHFEPFHKFNEVEMVKRVVATDASIAILPEATVRSEVAQHLLAAVPFEDGGHVVPLAVIFRKSRVLAPAARNFIQALKQPEPMQN